MKTVSNLDRVATRSDDVHQATLNDFGLIAIDVVSTEDVVKSLDTVGAA